MLCPAENFQLDDSPVTHQKGRSSNLMVSLSRRKPNEWEVLFDVKKPPFWRKGLWQADEKIYIEARVPNTSNSRCCSRTHIDCCTRNRPFSSKRRDMQLHDTHIVIWQEDDLVCLRRRSSRRPLALRRKNDPYKQLENRANFTAFTSCPDRHNTRKLLVALLSRRRSQFLLRPHFF